MSDSTGSSVEYVGRVAQQTLHDYITKIEELTAAHDRLRKENAALREDARRWRELRDGESDMGDHHLVLARMSYEPIRLICEVADCDEAMDAVFARAAPQGAKDD